MPSPQDSPTRVSSAPEKQQAQVTQQASSTSSSATSSFRRRASIPLPRCSSCDATYPHLRRFVTRRSNRNGNAGRPYLKCMPCEKFITFLDDRGIDLDGPHCFCDFPCRLQVSGRYVVTTTPRGLHYVCAFGRCKYHEPVKRDGKGTDTGEQETVPEEFVDLFARLKVI